LGKPSRGGDDGGGGVHGYADLERPKSGDRGGVTFRGVVDWRSDERSAAPSETAPSELTDGDAYDLGGILQDDDDEDEDDDDDEDDGGGGHSGDGQDDDAAAVEVAALLGLVGAVVAGWPDPRGLFRCYLAPGATELRFADWTEAVGDMLGDRVVRARFCPRVVEKAAEVLDRRRVRALSLDDFRDVARFV
jgi:hypothetical protein